MYYKCIDLRIIMLGTDAAAAAGIYITNVLQCCLLLERWSVCCCSKSVPGDTERVSE